MKVRYRETGRAADVVMREDAAEGLVLAGHGNLFYREEEQDDGSEWTVGADSFADDFDLVEATEYERRRLREAGFRVE